MEGVLVLMMWWIHDGIRVESSVCDVVGGLVYPVTVTYHRQNVILILQRFLSWDMAFF